MKPPKGNETLKTVTNLSRRKQILIQQSLQLNSGNTYVLQHTNICISGASHFSAILQQNTYNPKYATTHTSSLSLIF